MPYLRETVDNLTKSSLLSPPVTDVVVRLPGPEWELQTSNCCFLSATEKLSRDASLEPRLDEVLVKFSETHQTS